MTDPTGGDSRPDEQKTPPLPPTYQPPQTEGQQPPAGPPAPPAPPAPYGQQPSPPPGPGSSSPYGQSSTPPPPSGPGSSNPYGPPPVPSPSSSTPPPPSGPGSSNPGSSNPYGPPPVPSASGSNPPSGPGSSNPYGQPPAPSGSTPPPPAYQPGGVGGGQTPPPSGPGYPGNGGPGYPGNGGPGYPGGPGQPPQNPGDFPGKTLGIVGLIVAIFANVVGLIISIIARNQSKRAGYKNGPATAGIVVGAVLTGIGVIVAIFSIIAVVIAGTTTAAVVGGLSDYTPSATTSPSDGGDTDETQVDVFSIQVGDCLNDTTSGTEVSDVPLVNCSDPHDYEVYYDFDITGGSTYPGDDVISQDAEDGCSAAYEAFVGIPYADSTLNYNYYTPTTQSWENADDRLVSCVIYDPAGKVTGTLEGSKR